MRTVAASRDKKTLNVGDLGRYQPTGILGSGTFGTVIKARDGNNQEVAIKLFPRGSATGNLKTNIFREIVHQASLKHPFIVGLKEVLLTPKYLGLVMEFMNGGDLLHYMRGHYPIPCQEDEARWIFQQLVIGLDYSHKMGVANRDLKLQNLLVNKSRQGDRPSLKICDFGYSKHEASSSAKSNVGTPIFMAPEIVFSYSSSYDAKVADIWSCGVILYEQIFMCHPFDHTAADFYTKFRAGDYRMPEHVPASEGVKDLLSKMLVSDPTVRAGIQEIMAHPWFLKNLPNGALEMNERTYLRRAPNLSFPCKEQLDAMVTAAGRRGNPEDKVWPIRLIGRDQ